MLTGADGVMLTGADALTYTGLEGVMLTGADQAGLQGFDSELAMALDGLPDTSFLNVFVVFHHQPTDADLNDLRAAGILGGTIYHNLPMAMINATKGQIAAISQLPSVRSIYSNKTTKFFTHDTRRITGQTSVLSDPTLTQANGGVPLSGQGVTVAVLDTGIDATHPDLPFGTEVEQNVLVADLQGSAPGFLYPIVLEGLPDTDLVMGHGTFVASVVAGSGAASASYYGGMAPGAKLLGVSVGNASMFFVLSGIDYILSHQIDQNIKVVNCSFGVNGLFDAHDPVNIATKILHDSGISVVFAAGNNGDQPNALNPYSVAPWVIGVGSGTKSGSLSTFSSRGAAGYGVYHPTLIAPGENIVAARATGVNVVGTEGLAGALVSPANDLQNIPLPYLLRYTMSSGTSFAAPHVAGTIALMLQANPSLTPDQIKTILQETATPMLGYSRYDVGAGYLNAYAAVRKAAFASPYGAFRRQLQTSNFTISRDPLVSFSGQAAPCGSFSRSIQIPRDTLFATVEVGWVNPSALNSQLGLKLCNGSGSVVSVPAALLAGSGFKKVGVTLKDPSPGTWTLTVTNPALLPFGPAQGFDGAIETIHANFSGIGDVNQLPCADQQAIKSAVRAGLVPPLSTGFGPTMASTRLDLARALMLGSGARMPQYLPAAPEFTDLADDASLVFAESVTNSPNGNLLGAVAPNFNPQNPAERITAAIAAVKALGLDQLAQTASNPGISDWYAIPQAERGYAAVAVSQKLLALDAFGRFRSSDSITRAELAGMAVALQRASR